MNELKIFHRHPLIMVFGLILFASLVIWLNFTAEIKSIFQPRVIEISGDGQNPTLNAPSAEASSPDRKTEPAVNFLLLGAPGQGNDAPDLTDTIILARLDETKNKIYLFSLPRDLLVKIPDGQSYAKLNSLYAFNKNNAGQEFNTLIAKTRDITGLTVNHYVFVDLLAVKRLVDIFGGVNIMVAKDINDPAFPGPNHSFETFQISAGWRYLDGATALKYLRTRSSARGDFDRTARQQQVLQALKQKVLALNFWDIGKFLEIYNALSSNIKSDLDLWQIKGFWDKIKNIQGTNVIKNELSAQNLIVSGQVNFGGAIASILKPAAGVENYGEIQKYIADIIR